MIYFILIFASYILTLYPTISPYRDSGDLISAAWTLGVAHPPGYPLYSLIGKIFLTIIPFGNAAYRVNLMSAVAGAAAVAVLLKRFKGFTAGIILLSLGFTIPFWRLSLVSEMYSVNGFFVALAIAAVLNAVYSADHREIFRNFALAFFLVGIASGNHLTAVLILPPAALAVYLVAKKNSFAQLLSFTNLLYLAAFFALGASVFLYLPLRSIRGAVVNWGDPSNLERFLRVVTRADYGGLKLHPEESAFVWNLRSVFEQLLFYLKLLRLRFGMVPIFFAAVGALRSVYRIPFMMAGDKKSSSVGNIGDGENGVREQITALFVFAGFVVSGPLFTLLANLPVGKTSTIGILEPHFVMPDIFFVALAIVGVTAFSRRGEYRRHIFFIVKKILIFSALVLSFFYVAVIFISKSGDYRYNFTAYDYARNILATSPYGKTIIYDPDDTTAFTLDYFQYVLGRRPDVAKAVYFRTRWGYERLKKFSKEILPPREISSGMELARELLSYNLSSGRTIFSELPSKFPTGASVMPVGILHQIISLSKNDAGTSSPPLSGGKDVFGFYFMRGISFGDMTPDAVFTADFFNSHVISYYASAMVNNGLYAAQRGESVEAENFYMTALAVSDALAPAWNNLGTLAFTLGDYRKAALFFKKSAALEPSNPTGVINAGLAYRRMGDTDVAVKFFESALKNGFNPTAMNEIGLIYYEKGDYAKALRIFQDIIGRAPDFAAAYYNAALVCQRMNLRLESEKYLGIYYRMESRSTDPKH